MKQELKCTMKYTESSSHIMYLIHHMLGAVRCLVADIGNGLILLLFRIPRLFGDADICVSGSVVTKFKAHGGIRIDGSYEPLLVYEVYKVVRGKFGVHFCGECRVTATGAEYFPDCDLNDSVTVEFSKAGWLNPYTTINNREHWHSLTKVLFDIVECGVKPEEKSEDDEDQKKLYDRGVERDIERSPEGLRRSEAEGDCRRVEKDQKV